MCRILSSRFDQSFFLRALSFPATDQSFSLQGLMLYGLCMGLGGLGFTGCGFLGARVLKEFEFLA